MSKKSRTEATSNPGWYSKGRTGNRGGRPRASRAPQPSAFDVIVQKTLIVIRHGIAREITAVEALQHRIYQDAMAGHGHTPGSKVDRKA